MAPVIYCTHMWLQSSSAAPINKPRIKSGTPDLPSFIVMESRPELRCFPFWCIQVTWWDYTVNLLSSGLQVNLSRIHISSKTLWNAALCSAHLAAHFNFINPPPPNRTLAGNKYGIYCKLFVCLFDPHEKSKLWAVDSPVEGAVMPSVLQ